MTIKIICRIRDLRKEREMTQEKLAEKLGISRQSLINLEQGKWLPSLDLAFNIADFFQKSVEELFCEMEKMHQDIEENINKNISLNKPQDQLSSFSKFDHPSSLKLHGVRKEQTMPRGLMPFRPFGVSRFFDDDFDEGLMSDIPMIRQTMSTPAINVYEKNNDVIVEAQIPGIKEEDLNIEVADDHVAISGERKQETEEKDKNFYRKEVSYGSFSRVVPLPVKVNSDKAEASAEDGVLTITLPKAEEKKRKQVKLKVKKNK